MASKYSGKTHLKIFPGCLSKIGPMGTLSKSQGTKILVSKIFSHHLEMMLFYVFLGFVMRKMLKIVKNSLILLILLCISHQAPITFGFSAVP